MVTTGYRESHLIIAGVAIKMRGILLCRGLPIAEVPIVAVDMLPRGIGDGGAAELSGAALAYSVEVEVSYWLGKYDDFSGASGRLTVNGGDACVSASHFVGAIGNTGILLVGSESVGASPTIYGT